MAASAWPQSSKPDFVKVSPPPSAVKAAPGASFEVPLKLEIQPDYHINAEKPTFDYLIPTKLDWTSKEFKLAGIEYPKPEQASFSFSPGTKLDVYQGTVIIRSRFQAAGKQPIGKAMLEGKLHYQACDDKMCYPPATVTVKVPIEVAATGKKK